MKKIKILILLPSLDFDPSEVALSWKNFKSRGFEVTFATPGASPAQGDQVMITGLGLDPWGLIPGLRNFALMGLMLRARKDARQAYREMLGDNAFNHPLQWVDAFENDFHGLVLPGGHRARGMREYLESKVLQNLVVAFFTAKKPVAAICHGVLLAARSIDPKTGHSVLHGRKTTALPWAFESTAATTARFTRYWDPCYYRTYQESESQPKGYMGVEQEVTRALEKPSDFLDVPVGTKGRWKKTSGLFRDTIADPSAAWLVRDGVYISARWPGDVNSFANAFSDLLEEHYL